MSENVRALCCVGVWGRRARDVVTSLSDDDLSNEAFPYMTALEPYVASVPVRALRISYVGELGWEIYAPTEFGLALWDALWQAGGRALGYVTSAGWGATVEESIAYGYVPAEHAEVGTRVSVHSDGRRHEATVAAEPLFDPANDRLRDAEPVATP